jgi:hypothetical protein
MSETIFHYQSSLENVRVNHPELYEQEKAKVEQLLTELHKWLDWYAGKEGEENGVAYNFTGITKIRHRAKRHHLEGINEAVRIFSERYGEKFSKLIRQEATRHVRDDVKYVMDEIPFASDYPAIFSKHFRD